MGAHIYIYIYVPIPLACKLTMHGWNKCNKSFTFHLFLHHFDLVAYKYKYTTTLFMYNNFASIINKTPAFVFVQSKYTFRFSFTSFNPQTNK